MEYTSNFDIDLQFGQIAETKVRDILVRQGILLEVKRDKRLRDTGNIFFEYYSRGKESGLAVTKAEWIVIVTEDMNTMAWFRTEVLKERLKELLRKGYAKKVNGGDCNTSKGIIVKIQHLFQDVR